MCTSFVYMHLIETFASDTRYTHQIKDINNKVKVVFSEEKRNTKIANLGLYAKVYFCFSRIRMLKIKSPCPFHSIMSTGSRDQ